MATLDPMNSAREPCRSHCGALRRWVRRKSTSRLRNQAHAPQSAAAARTLRLRATSLSLLAEKVSQPALSLKDTLRGAGSMAAIRAGSQGETRNSTNILRQRRGRNAGIEGHSRFSGQIFGFRPLLFEPCRDLRERGYT